MTFGRNYMISGSEEGSLVLWDLKNFNILASFLLEPNAKGLDRKILSTHFSIDGKNKNFVITNLFLLIKLYVFRGIFFVHVKKAFGLLWFKRYFKKLHKRHVLKYIRRAWKVKIYYFSYCFKE